MGENKSFWLLTSALAIILIVGLVISVIQTKHKKNVRSEAETTSLQGCTVSVDKLKISEDEQSLFDQINIYRQQYGLNTLTWSDSLIRGASWMSNDMLASGSLSHIDSMGRNVPTRISNCGYTSHTSLGENIDSGTRDSQSILDAWKHSASQNANLLSANFKEVGIALESDLAKSSHYWTLDLGSRGISPTPSITLTVAPSIILSPTVIKTPTPGPTYVPIPTVSPTKPLNPTPTVKKPTPTQSVPTAKPTLIPLPTNPPIPTVTPIPTVVPTPTTPPDYVPNPQDMQLFATVKLTGIGNDANRNPKHLTRHVVVGIYDLENKLVTEGNGFIIYDRINLFRGVIHFGPVENGTYFVKILSDHLLRADVQPTFQVLEKERLNILPEVTLIQGDINDDNVVNIKDYNLALSCFQSKKCKDKDKITEKDSDKETIDFNDDGLSDVIDYNILLHNYWETLGD